MTAPFGYLLDRISEAKFDVIPFPHLYLTDFLAESDFDAIVNSSDITLPIAAGFDELLLFLERAGYQSMPWPGCTQSKAEYLLWLEESVRPQAIKPTCDGQGMAFQLSEPSSALVRSLAEFFRSAEFEMLVREKFHITHPTAAQPGLHKYLHGYEISPHPDMRRKALTWMLNVNPAAESESLDYHTHYMTLRRERSFIAKIWQDNSNIDTCWLPWSWCETIKQHTHNNSISIFAPRWDSMHAVKTRYDHLSTQRTQFYGNLWYEEGQPQLLGRTPEFTDYDFIGGFQNGPRAAD
ncbi:MAG: hypothetical protein HY826_13035 [Actinobacteria bacterium]|nr:hypothetical protein [Actinomycetota bacterium]